MLVKPVEGRLILDPRTMRAVPDEGLNVPDSDPFWVQRVAQGDLVKDDTKPAKAATPAAPTVGQVMPPAPPAPPARTLETGEQRSSAPSQEKPQ